MKRLYLHPNDIVPFNKERYRSAASEQDYHTLITEPTCVYIGLEDKAELKIVYDVLPDNPILEQIESILDDVEYNKISRISGPLAETQIFGSRPANAIRMGQASCSASKMAQVQPELHAIVAKGSTVIADVYERYNPGLYLEHSGRANDKVRPEYHLEETAFTSGIINKNNPLGYHLDAGNFSDVWSGMIVYKRFVEGGYLSCPELGIGFQLSNRSLLLFDGQGMVHGVTPITKLHPTLSRRYSIVYYSLQKMWKCLPIDDEVERANQERTMRERRRTDPNYNAKFLADLHHKKDN